MNKKYRNKAMVGTAITLPLHVSPTSQRYTNSEGNMVGSKSVSLIFLVLFLQGCVSDGNLRATDNSEELRKRWNFSYAIFLGGVQEVKSSKSDVVQRFGSKIKNVELTASDVNRLLEDDKTSTREFTKAAIALCSSAELLEKEHWGFPSIEITSYLSDISLMVGYLAELYKPSGSLIKECEYAVWR